MKAQQRTRLSKTGTVGKHGRLTFEGIGSLIKFRHHVSKPVNLQGSFSTLSAGPSRVEEQLSYNLEAERRRANARAYSNMMPPR
jgi:hypothetical protein